MTLNNFPLQDFSFTNPTKGALSFGQVIAEIIAFIGEDPERRYRLLIGTDSEARESAEAVFVSVAVIHRVGRAARYFWSRSKTAAMPSFRQRIYTEATYSLALAEALTSGVGESLNGYLTSGTCELEIHVDIGQFGPTREMIREIVGMISGNGFRVKIKPESCAASTVADKHI